MSRSNPMRFLTLFIVGWLVVSAAAVKTLAQTPSKETAAITVTTLVSAVHLDDGRIELVGVSPEIDAASRLLSVEWRMEESAWWPAWHVYLVGDAALLEPAGEDETNGRVRLATITPNSGATYETTLSYDPDSGLVSVSMRDPARQERLVRTGLRIARYDGRLTPSAMSGTDAVAVSTGYSPLDVQWDVGVYTEKEFLPVHFLKPKGDNRVRVNVRGPLSGEFVLLNRKGSNTRELARYPATDGASLLPIPVDALRLGSSTLVFQYVDEGSVIYCDSQDIEVGRVHVKLDSVRYNRATDRLETRLNLVGNGELDGVEAIVEIDVWALEWDPVARSYGETMHESHTFELGEFGRIASRNGHAPISVPASDRAGTWRLDMRITTRPDVSVQVDRASRIVSTHDPAEIGPGESYTIAVLPDTQLYSKFHPEIYLRQTEWLAANASQRDIAFALHLGDITEDNFPVQWLAARDAHDAMAGVVPYVLSVGNHDYAQYGRVADRKETRVNEYFGEDDFPHMGGAMKPRRLENTYHAFRIAGEDYLVISLEFAPSDEALEWANKVAQAYANHEVIVITHAYLHPTGVRVSPGSSARTFPLGENPATTMNDGEEIWAKFASRHENVSLILSGHLSSSAIPKQTSIGQNGNRVHEMLIDYQSEPNGGNGYLVLMEFAPDQTVRVRSYSPYLNQFKSNTNAYGYRNEFIIDLDQ